jgi:hypothetical protein
MGFTMKTIIIGFDIYFYQSGQGHIFEGKGFYWLFISPAIIFTYIFNNFWGFWRSAWLNLEIRSGNSKGMFLFLWQTIKYPIIMDIIITFSLVFLVQSDYFFVLLFYFCTLTTLMLTAFLWSDLFPKLISQAAPKKGSTSYWSLSFVFLIVLGLSLISKGGWLYVLVPLFLILAVIGLVISINIYAEKKYSIFSKLFRGE